MIRFTAWLTIRAQGETPEDPFPAGREILEDHICIGEAYSFNSIIDALHSLELTVGGIQEIEGAIQSVLNAGDADVIAMGYDVMCPYCHTHFNITALQEIKFCPECHSRITLGIAHHAQD